MDATTLELYIYMCSPEPIVKWLKEEGVKTTSQAKDRLAPYVNGLVRTVMMTPGCTGNSLAGSASCIPKVLKAFTDNDGTFRKEN